MFENLNKFGIFTSISGEVELYVNKNCIKEYRDEKDYCMYFIAWVKRGIL